MKRTIIFVALAIAACSQAGEEPPAPEPAPETFNIRKVDLWREQPNDICRSVDREFLQKLTDRVQSGVEAQFKPSFRFEDFTVRDGDVEGRRIAAFRFKIDRGAGPEMMTAVGEINVKTCAIGQMKLGAGANDMMFDDANTVIID